MVRLSSAPPDPIPAPKRIYRGGGRLDSLPSVTHVPDGSMPDDGSYRLEIRQSGVKIVSGGAEGGRWGAVTLAQYSFMGCGFPVGIIEDAPTYPYRGLLFDCSRTFFETDELKTLIDCMSMFKLNRFHWHLTDDQGWRLESEVLPRLTEIGSVRSGSDFGRHHSRISSGGFYTREQVRELIAFARARGVQIVPELDFPGHCSAFLAAYPEFSCSGEPSEVRTAPGIYENVLCPGKDAAIEAVFSLIDETAKLFDGEYLHIGGDEAPDAHWKTCPDCKKRMESLGFTTTGQLRSWFTDLLAERVRKNGKKPICWNDAEPVAKDTAMQYWFGDKDAVRQFAENGGRVILSELPYCYTDYSYAQTPLKKCFSYRPEDFIPRERLLGIEAALWSSYAHDMRRVGFMMYPRAAAIADIAWNGGRVSRETSYAAFRTAFEALTPMFGSIGIVPAKLNRTDPKGPVRVMDFTRFWAENLTPSALASEIKNFRR
ncbi:MAG: beta-N-acetylhexosaminidase [Clostridia bacterium]|nr:beta-N-acetylhexosaminidase [Clostridia bacterium]